MFRFDTVKPGAIHDADGRRHAPHVNVTVFARGMLVHAFTRMYFCRRSRSTRIRRWRWSTSARRDTLVAERTATRDGRVVYRWDIHLQGERETVFFDA